MPLEPFNGETFFNFGIFFILILPSIAILFKFLNELFKLFICKEKNI